MLKSGQFVNIYGKPLTQEDFEGRATLLEPYRPDEGDGLSMWVVMFQDEPDVEYVRTVYEARKESENV